MHVLADHVREIVFIIAVLGTCDLWRDEDSVIFDIHLVAVFHHCVVQLRVHFYHVGPLTLFGPCDLGSTDLLLVVPRSTAFLEDVLEGQTRGLGALER